VRIWRVEGVEQMPDCVPGRTAGTVLSVGVVGLSLSALGGSSLVKVKVKVKFTLQQATKAQRRSRGIALLFP
jgi:hypothetical protein